MSHLMKVEAYFSNVTLLLGGKIGVKPGPGVQ